MLSSNTHQVYTAVTVISPDGTVYTDADRTDVTFTAVDDAEILDYVRSG
jgi:predicted house-cleaning NTP pyrophosphatase (Maf/HAM1 superfamily)